MCTEQSTSGRAPSARQRLEQLVAKYAALADPALIPKTEHAVEEVLNNLATYVPGDLELVLFASLRWCLDRRTDSWGLPSAAFMCAAGFVNIDCRRREGDYDNDVREFGEHSAQRWVDTLRELAAHRRNATAQWGLEECSAVVAWIDEVLSTPELASVWQDNLQFARAHWQDRMEQLTRAAQ